MAERVQVISSEAEGKTRSVKVRRFGRSDIQTASESVPFGIDSKPIKGMIAVYADTHRKGKSVIVGYINIEQAVLEGEARLYSVNDNKAVSAYVKCTKTGKIELSGNSKHLVKFEELKTAYDQLKAKVNELISAYNTHVHASNGTPTVSTVIATTASMDTSKAENIQTA